MYALIRGLLRFIANEQKKKHTAEDILHNLCDMLHAMLGK